MVRFEGCQSRNVTYGHLLMIIKNSFVKIRRGSRLMLKPKHYVIYATRINVDSFKTQSLWKITCLSWNISVNSEIYGSKECYKRKKIQLEIEVFEEVMWSLKTLMRLWQRKSCTIQDVCGYVAPVGLGQMWTWLLEYQLNVYKNTNEIASCVFKCPVCTWSDQK